MPFCHSDSLQFDDALPRRPSRNTATYAAWVMRPSAPPAGVTCGSGSSSYFAGCSGVIPASTAQCLPFCFHGRYALRSSALYLSCATLPPPRATCLYYYATALLPHFRRFLHLPFCYACQRHLHCGFCCHATSTAAPAVMHCRWHRCVFAVPACVAAVSPTPFDLPLAAARCSLRFGRCLHATRRADRTPAGTRFTTTPA